MSKVLIFQHVAYEILGTLNPLLKEHRYRLRYVNFDRHPHQQIDIAGYQGLIILGGPMNVDQEESCPHLREELRAIETALQADIPILGICLGAQLIAKALGADVGRNPCKEIGWYNVQRTEAGKGDPVLSHFGETEKIFQWHGDTFEMPRDAVHLASSKACLNQAFRYGDRVYGFQFHLECDEAMIYRWLEVPRYREELEELKGTIDPQGIRAQTPTHIANLMALSQRTFGAFLDLIGKPGRTTALPSR